MKTLVFPFVIWNICLQRKNNDLIRYTMNACILIIVLYGLFLTSTKGLNYYLTAMMSVNGATFNEDYAMADDRMFGRISSVFSHPMTFGLFLGFSFFYIYAQRHRQSALFTAVSLGLIIVSMLFCGVRSCIGAFLVTIFYYLANRHNVKLVIISVLVGLVLYAFIKQIPQLNNYISSITDVENKKGHVSGSSIQLRITQLHGCLNEIESTPLLGKGYYWSEYYHAKNGNHPDMLAFESLVFVVLCNGGIIGCFIWIITFFRLQRGVKKRFNKDSSLLISLLSVYYIVYSIITGEYGYMQVFMIFYTLILIDYYANEKSSHFGFLPSTIPSNTRK